ncbi:MAG: UDP-N-acetylglucosamine 2-epimerase [bacterium]
MKNILGITGIKSDYELMKPIFKSINKHQNLSLEVLITGAHLSSQYGNTHKSVEKDGFNYYKIESLIDSNSLSSRVKSLGVQLTSLVDYVKNNKTDIILVLGDREESLAGATIGTYMNIPVAHISGGDKVYGNVDDTVRHAVTKLSHIHFPTTAENAERIMKMGEEKWRIHTVGASGLDSIREVPNIGITVLSKQLNISLRKPYILLIQHPVSSQVDKAGEQMETTLKAVTQLEYDVIITSPNSDPGSKEMIKVIKEYEKKHDNIHFFSYLDRKIFVNIFRQASVLIGNSSCGIIEAPFLKVPTINIGIRQKQRQHADNIVFVDHDKEEIIKWIKKAIYNKSFKDKVKKCKSLYGDGKTGSKIAGTLANIDINDKLINKKITY